MESKLALDASERGHGQPEASDVVGVGRRQADPRLGGGLRASRLSAVWREGKRGGGGIQRHSERELSRGEKGERKVRSGRVREESVKQHKHSTSERESTDRSFINIMN